MTSARTPLVVLALLVVVGPLAGACNRTPENPPPQCEDAACTVDEDGVLHTVVDASDRDAWVYFDLETAGVVAVEEPLDDDGWDLAFRRMVVKTNGGVNGSAGVQACILDDTDFDDVTVAPLCEWIEDQDSRPDPRDPGGTVFNDDPWYDYDLVEHTLHAKADRVHVVRSVEGGFWKLGFLDYYNVDGLPAWPSFRWSTLAPF